MRKFVIGDIHGAHKALLQCFEQSGFDRDKDLLICLGDVADGYSEIPQCFDTLKSIKNLVYILGNHDQWFLEWGQNGRKPDVWLFQGGSKTISQYNNGVDPDHLAILKNAKGYHLLNNMVFVHGGIDPAIKLEDQPLSTLVWDRELVMEAFRKDDPGTSITGYEKVFVGHTPTLRFDSAVPLQLCEVVLMDTGAGWGQPLSMLEIETGGVFQSDPTQDLYPGETTR